MARKLIDNVVQQHGEETQQPEKIAKIPWMGILDADALAAEDIARSGLTMAELSVTAQILRYPENGPWAGWLGAAERFPYFDRRTGKPVRDKTNEKDFCRWRAVSPIISELPKYMQESGSPVQAYFPPNLADGWAKAEDDRRIDLFVVEGEKKAGKACQCGFATIGIGGIWNFKSKSENLLPDLATFAWKGHRVFLTYDSDPPSADDAHEKRKHLELARQRLANELIPLGAEVYYIDLPHLTPDHKTGLDDFLLARGADAFRALIETATRMEVAELPDGLTLEQVVERMNEKYMIAHEGGKTFVYDMNFDQALGRRCITRFPFNDFRDLYLNRKVMVGTNAQGNPIIKTWANAWLEHNDRRQYLGGITFDPSGKSPGDVYNLWQGFHVEPTEGNWSLMRDHIRDVVCNGVTEHFAYLMNWMALMFQKPAQPGEVAVVMRGLKGTGKGTIAKALNHMTGQHGMTISNAEHLTGRFNGHLRDCIFLFADEAFFAGDKRHLGILNSLITDEHLFIEDKQIRATQYRNRLHIMMASNEKWVVPASTDERRYLMLEVSDSHRGDHAYFEQLHRQLDTGGYEAMLYELLHRDLTGFNVRIVPTTTGLQAQQKLSLPTAEAWWMECLMQGYAYLSPHGAEGFLGDWAELVSTDILYVSYTAFAKRAMDRHPLLRETFGRFIVQMGGQQRRLSKALITDSFNGPVLGDRPHGYRLGTLEGARAEFCRVTKLPVEWPSEKVEDAPPTAPAPRKKAKY